jgi:hypothetical protein
LAEKTIAWVSATAVFTGLLAWRIREIASHARADPWPPEADIAARARDAVPLCVNCLCPQEGHPWFCPHCGFPAGEYVTTMPYLQVFALGELFRRGVIGPPEKGFVQKVFFVLSSAGEYFLFAPLYWFWMARKASGKPICQAKRIELGPDEIG